MTQHRSLGDNMTNTPTTACAAVVVVTAATLLFAGRQQPRAATPAQPAAATAAPEDANREAILKSARDFAAAFNKGDAKAVAALYAENGEFRDAGGRTLIGRAAIEKVYA